MTQETAAKENQSMVKSRSVLFLPLGVVSGISILMLILFLVLARKSDAARTDFYRAQGELESYRKAVWRLEKLDPKQLQWQVARMNARFPSSEQLGLILGEITELAKNYGISISSITPSEKTDARSKAGDALAVLNRTPIEMQVRGAYERLSGFLSQLSNLEQGMIKINQFRLEKESAQETGALMLSLTASLYVRQSLEQEVLKESLSQTSPVQRKAGRSRFDKLTRNPFTKMVVRDEISNPVVLQGILYDTDEPIALVNGESRKVGDVVNGMKIVEIHPDSVVFEKDGEQTKMRLRWD